MPRFIKTPLKKFYLPAILLSLGFSKSAYAAGPPAPSLFDSPLAIALIVLMLLLLIVIAILGNILLGAAEIKLKKNKKATAGSAILPLLILFLLSNTSLFAQTGPVNNATTSSVSAGIGGISAAAFYVMAAVIFLELGIILVLLVNIRILLKKEKEKLAVAQPVTEEERRSRLSWWDKFNKFRPATQEMELDLGHDYDGIRELNNRLPPWWLYGFYLTIIFACIYLWRFHVAHSAPLSKEEFEIAMTKGDLEVQQYLKMKGDNVDENSVTLLKDAADLEAGKAIFTEDGLCGTCHGKDASGMINGSPGVGPNLTDDYWIHGGSIHNIFTTIKYGINGKGMPEWGSRFSPKEIAQIASYVKSLHGSNPPVHKAPDGQLYKDEDVVTSTSSADSAKVKPDSNTIKTTTH